MVMYNVVNCDMCMLLIGVLFALKVITTAETPTGTAYIMGMPVPSKYAAWAELLAIHLLVPNASFMGHLAGILAGCAYTSTFVGSLIDHIICTITGTSCLLTLESLITLFC